MLGLLVDQRVGEVDVHTVDEPLEDQVADGSVRLSFLALPELFP
jgi:hypothetical protein